MVSLIISFVVGFVVGALVFRNNAKKAEKIVQGGELLTQKAKEIAKKAR